MREPLVIIVLSVFLCRFVFGQSRTYQKQEIIEDLSFLKTQLEDNHPNINVYTPPDKFLSFFENLSIPNHIAEEEVYSIISSVNEVIFFFSALCSKQCPSSVRKLIILGINQ